MVAVVFCLLKTKSSMIIIKVQGGLGNQLLQYSIGRVIERSSGKKVAYDLSFFEHDTKYTKRPYLLDMFTTKVRVATLEEIQKTRYPYFFSKVWSLGYRLLNKYFLKKYYIAYDKQFLPMSSRKSNLYAEGFWQSYLYYQKDLENLSSEISLKDDSLLQDFKQKNSFTTKVSVSVHIRRGDFLNKNAGTKVVEKEYYQQAVSVLEQKVANPTYFIFSDDIEWVRKEMGHLFNDAVFVSSFGLPDYVEFALLKECHHAILSNSTFCWFATLLTYRENKVVIYPTDWKNVYLNNDIHICPPTWVGLE
jgi:Glycosyl transferase family 11